MKIECGVPLITGGDFNEVLNIDDRKGAIALSQSSCLFKEWVESVITQLLACHDQYKQPGATI
ncbi:uncharacterized protein DS421_1g28400 [Arachis hypogaea]|nr:uncharacterized protein DS421_1g28400 [Arachis hypogaea]